MIEHPIVSADVVKLSLWRIPFVLVLSFLSIVIFAVLILIAVLCALPIVTVGFVLLYPIRLALRRLTGQMWGRKWGLL